MHNQGPPTVENFPAAKQRRLDVLLDKNSEGTITSRERMTLEKLVAEAESLMIANGKRLAKFAQQSSTPPQAAVPITIWISPAVTQR